MDKKVSLLAQKKTLSSAKKQVAILEKTDGFMPFAEKLVPIGLTPLLPKKIDVFQANLGKMCNQVCKHCHVDAGPDRKEIMSPDTMKLCLEALDNSDISTVDLTGGAPEMNPNFRWFVEELSKRKKHIIVRCNLTIILANPKYSDLPKFFKDNNVEVVSSLPHFSAKRTDAQRGNGVFEQSIEALQLLNKEGYGLPDSSLKLNLVYNPSGAFLPGDQNQLEQDFKTKLLSQYNIQFHQLYAITNLPVSRFLDYLIKSHQYEEYMEELIDAFNPVAAQGVMCRDTISVGWDGYLYDCDFNQMLEMKIKSPSTHISDFDQSSIEQREIVLNQHCYGCTAGSGSSCGGTTT